MISRDYTCTAGRPTDRTTPPQKPWILPRRFCVFWNRGISNKTPKECTILICATRAPRVAASLLCALNPPRSTRIKIFCVRGGGTRFFVCYNKMGIAGEIALERRTAYLPLDIARCMLKKPCSPPPRGNKIALFLGLFVEYTNNPKTLS